MADNPTFQIPRDVIEPIVQAHITAAIASALGNKHEILEKAVATILNMKVDEKGKHNDSEYYNKTEWIRWAVQDCVQRAVLSALQTEISKHQDQMQAVIISQLKQKNSPLLTQMAKAMVGGFCNEETLKYRIAVEVKGYRD